MEPPTIESFCMKLHSVQSVQVIVLWLMFTIQGVINGSLKSVTFWDIMPCCLVEVLEECSSAT